MVSMVTPNASSAPGFMPTVPSSQLALGDSDCGMPLYERVEEFPQCSHRLQKAVRQFLGELAHLKSVHPIQERQQCFVTVLKQKQQLRGCFPLTFDLSVDKANKKRDHYSLM